MLKLNHGKFPGKDYGRQVRHGGSISFDPHSYFFSQSNRTNNSLLLIDADHRSLMIFREKRRDKEMI